MKGHADVATVQVMSIPLVRSPALFALSPLSPLSVLLCSRFDYSSWCIQRKLLFSNSCFVLFWLLNKITVLRLYLQTTEILLANQQHVNNVAVWILLIHVITRPGNCLASTNATISIRSWYQHFRKRRSKYFSNSQNKLIKIKNLC